MRTILPSVKYLAQGSHVRLEVVCKPARLCLGGGKYAMLVRIYFMNFELQTCFLAIKRIDYFNYIQENIDRHGFIGGSARLAV